MFHACIIYFHLGIPFSHTFIRIVQIHGPQPKARFCVLRGGSEINKGLPQWRKKSVSQRYHGKQRGSGYAIGSLRLGCTNLESRNNGVAGLVFLERLLCMMGLYVVLPK